MECYGVSSLWDLTESAAKSGPFAHFSRISGRIEWLFV